MRISSIKIEKLFGYYSYDIDLNHLDPLFIITGLNGTGKTTVMKILDNLSQGKLHYFYELSFEHIEIILENEVETNGNLLRLLITKKTRNERPDNKQIHKLPFFDTSNKSEYIVIFSCISVDKGKGKKVSECVLTKNTNPLLYNIKITDQFKYYGGLSFKTDYDNVDKKYFVEDQKIGRSKSLPFSNYSSSLRVKFIEAQRLLISLPDENDDDNKKTTKLTIKDIADKLQHHLRDARYHFLDESQKKDKSLINNLLYNSEESLNEEEYNKYIDSLKPTIDELKNYDLAEETIYPYIFDKREILSVYIKDQKAKLDSFSELLKELNLFSSLLEKKKFAHKYITFSPQYGLRALTDRGEKIDLEDLSSGEQNEIIILYQLIFDVPSNTILLIDEPEISLHVIWQEEFMNDLEEISKIRNQQMIIATHSPQIIGEKWNKCFDLSEKNLNR